MSHFSEVKTNLKNASVLKKALKNMGFEVVEAEEGVDVRGFFGDTQKAEFKVLTKTHYDIGFKKNEQGSYELVADWDLMPQVADIEKDLFLAHTKRTYAQTAIMELAEEKGYELEMVEDENSGQIEMVVSQW